ncbi:hypothetical protein GCM10010151_16940 [Actinoallomurus spadix]|uniref:Uncharacterized protein n=1 Tax=Actinoallomurus spadix TaxID=79912 RepID=A0ABN0W7E7_9ACTN
MADVTGGAPRCGAADVPAGASGCGVGGVPGPGADDGAAGVTGGTATDEAWSRVRHHYAIGLNPKEANDPRCADVLELLPRHLAKDGVVAVGEVGLDTMGFSIYPETKTHGGNSVVRGEPED